MNAAVEIKTNFRDFTIEELVDARYEITQVKAQLNAEVKTLTEHVDTIDELLWQYHEQHPEVALINGSRAKVKWSTENQYSTEAGAKEAVRDWLFQNGHQYLMTWHLNRASTEEFVQVHGELPPHVTVYEKRKVSCTKL